MYLVVRRLGFDRRLAILGVDLFLSLGYAAKFIRSTFGLLDETMLCMPTSGGTMLARTIWRNCGKTRSRALELTNAPTLGEGSVAEHTMTEAEQDGIMLLAPRASAEPEPQMPDAGPARWPRWSAR